MFLPCFSSALAFASTSNAVSVPRLSILFAQTNDTSITFFERENRVEGNEVFNDYSGWHRV
jgi:hypothetical protein